MPESDRLAWLLDILGCEEMPLGIGWSPECPGGPGPDGSKPHDCLLKYLRIARTRRCAAWISREQPACRGGAIYAGFSGPSDMVARYVSTGVNGQPGERYLPRPETMWTFFDELAVTPAEAGYCVFRPLDQFAAREPGDADAPRVVVFFARGEMLAGLCQLACFALDDIHAVAFPFGSGCANILAWPLRHARDGAAKAVVGGADPSCRPYMATDELSFAVASPVFERLLDAAPHSFLTGRSWATVRRKIAQSHARWRR